MTFCLCLVLQVPGGTEDTWGSLAQSCSLQESQGPCFGRLKTLDLMAFKIFTDPCLSVVMFVFHSLFQKSIPNILSISQQVTVLLGMHLLKSLSEGRATLK